VWGCARNLDARVLGTGLVFVTAYVVTACRWHLDRAPHGFAATVQQLVAAQFLAAAIALAIFRVLTLREES
jgi:hypothetical protein